MKKIRDSIEIKTMKSPPPPTASSPPPALLRKGRLSPYRFTLLAFALLVTILYVRCIVLSQIYSPYQKLSENKNLGDKQLPFAIGETEKGCDLFSGSWVWDDVGRPLYDESECPYIQPHTACREHGRPDRDYRHWRWQPHACSLPSFNSTLMLETLRDKRMMFAGDSLNLGQYVSMVCLLQKHIPEDAKSMHTSGPLTVFTAKDYNATIEFYWAPFLLESNYDNETAPRASVLYVRGGSINNHGNHWKGVDVMVFSTYIWWMKGLDFNVLMPGSSEERNIVKLPTDEAYGMAIKSMLGWVKENMDPNKTRVFFTSMSPSHEKSVDWGDDRGGNCYNETSMVRDPNYWGSDSRKSIMRVIRGIFGNSTVPITFLNITQLSSYRKDAHSSIYRKQWSPLTPEQLANPVSYADCVHWCLPGVHDTWNELLFAKLFYP